MLGLGAFAAGVLLANTNYRAQVQADIGKVYGCCHLSAQRNTITC